jgi:hypothetical protein
VTAARAGTSFVHAPKQASSRVKSEPLGTRIESRAPLTVSPTQESRRSGSETEGGSESAACRCYRITSQ